MATEKLKWKDLLGLKREDLIDGLDEPAGATKALADAQGAITFFIWVGESWDRRWRRSLPTGMHF